MALAAERISTRLRGAAMDLRAVALLDQNIRLRRPGDQSAVEKDGETPFLDY